MSTKLTLTTIIVISISLVAQGNNNFTCEFCSAGLDFPDLPFVGFSSLNCSDWKAIALSADNQTECDETFRSFEPVCCPSTTDLPICDYCSEGLENPDYIFTPTNNTCAAIDISAKVSGERICEGVKYTEPLCCPSQATYKFPIMTTDDASDDTCYICGSPNVEMTKPDAKPMGGVSSDPEDQFTCAEMQEKLNAERNGLSCMETLAPFLLRFSPSACGCAGVEPLNPCGLCESKDVNNTAVISALNLTCEVGIPFATNSAPAICNTVNVDLVESTCCIDRTAGGDTIESGSATKFATIMAPLVLAFSIFA